MGQVPQYLVMGHGRAARHFCHYLACLDLACARWDRQQPEEVLTAQLAQATHVLLLVSDDAIKAVINKYLASSHAIKIHFSGSLVTSQAFGAHPLMTFGHDLYDLEKYKQIPFVLDDTAPDFETLLPGFDNPHVRLSAQDKAKYHALCVMAGNFSCILWQKLFNELEQSFDIPARTAHLYMQQQTENLVADHAAALTGPLARGDTQTLARNLQALEQDPFADIYQSFVRVWQKTQEKAP